VALFRRREKRSLDSLATVLANNGLPVRQDFLPSSLPVLSPLQAMRHPMVQRCVSYIASRVASTPLYEYEDSVSATAPLPSSPLIATPSARLSQLDWLQTVVANVAKYGNCTPMIVRRAGMYAIQAEVIDPRAVSYDARNDALVDSNRNVIPWEDVLHFKFPGLLNETGSWGLSPIALGNATIALGLAARDFGSGVFTESGIPPAIIYSKTALTEPQAADIKAAYQRSRTGARDPAVFGADLVFEKLSVTPEESQFLSTQDRVDSEICTMFGLPGELFGVGRSGSAVTYANLEQRSKALYDNTFAAWFRMIESVLSAQLPDRRNVRFDVTQFVTPDQLTQAQIGEIVTRAGLVTVNEWRFDQDRPPLEASEKKERPFQSVGLPALTSAGLMTVNEARFQLGLPPISGGDVLFDPTAPALAAGGTP